MRIRKAIGAVVVAGALAGAPMVIYAQEAGTATGSSTAPAGTTSAGTAAGAAAADAASGGISSNLILIGLAVLVLLQRGARRVESPDANVRARVADVLEER